MDAVLNWLWQGGVVAAASCVMLFALRRADANVRCAVCWTALLLIVGLPVLPSALSTTPAGGALLAAETEAIVSLPLAWWTSTLAILAAWMVWASIQFVRFVAAVVAIRRARARSRAFPADLESVLPHWRRVRFKGRRATLVLSNSVTSAAVLGWGAPTIAVAPSLLATLDPDDLDRVLIHEWAHVQRHDDVVNIVQVMFRIVAGWHPALWWIDRRLHVEREIACDEMTVAITGSPKSYAACLMKLANLRGTPRTMQTAPAVFTPSDLRARVLKIVSAQRAIAPVWSRSLAAAIVLVLCLVSVAVGGLTLVEARQFAQPLVSAPTLALSASSDRQVPVAPSVSSDTASERSQHRAHGRSSSHQPPKTEQFSALPQPPTEPIAPALSQESKTVDSTQASPADPVAAPAAAPQVVSVPDAPPHVPAQTTAESSRSPWNAATAGGVAIGKKSKDAGVATAGVFTRFARRVAGSF
jgi:bla regulator protein blaR1